MSTSTVTINNKRLPVPKDFFDVVVKASFGEEVQANITTEEFTFVLEAYQEIKNWIADGRNKGVGIFEGIPMSIVQSNGTLNASIFKGIIDLQSETVINDQIKQVSCRLRQDESLNQLDELLEPLDYGYLKDLGVITSSDYVNIDYVVNKINNVVESAITFITIYLLQKQIEDSIKEVGESVAIAVGIGSSGATGSIGSALFNALNALVRVAYLAALLIILLEFGKDLINTLVQPLRTHKGISLHTLLKKACEYIGFGFESSIEELDKVIYLPSNFNVDEFGLKSVISKKGTVTRGIPNASDIGYTCPELFQQARGIFNARFAVIDGVVQFHSENSEYWDKDSDWIKPKEMRDVSSKSYRYNTDELKSSFLLSFQTDISDRYTIKNYKGTAYQVLTDSKTVNNEKNKTIKGFDRVDIPYALGNRKNDLTPFEKSLLPLANLFDQVAGVFGGRARLASKIENKVGVLQVSNNNHSIPKLLYMVGGRIPSNHRDLFSAKALYDKYHVERSFVQDNYQRQRRYYENEVIPFGLESFVKLLKNSFFRDEFGRRSKIVDIEWNMSRDFATVSYWISDIYTTNLKETFIEPE